jgi:hypothetical protein
MSFDKQNILNGKEIMEATCIPHTTNTIKQPLSEKIKEIEIQTNDSLVNGTID